MAKGGGFIRSVKLLFDRAAGQRMVEEATETLARAGQEGGDALGKEVADAGKKAVRELTKSITEEYNRTMADARVKLAKGIENGGIDKTQFEAIRREADRTFNGKLIPAMERLRAEGKITQATFDQLSKRIKVVGDVGEADLGRAGRAVDRLRATVASAAAAFVAFFAVDRIRQFGRDAIASWEGGQESASRLKAVWEANAGAVGKTFQELLDFSDEVQRLTLFGGDAIERAMSQLLTYKSIAGDVFDRTIHLATDLSSVFGGVEQSTMALARALDDPIRGLGDLRKAGFTFEDSVTSQIKKLVAQNRLLDAQRLILSALEHRERPSGDQVGGGKQR
ncbi:MAG: hypothetical protein LC667_07025 [Thioalkalivibrio sp.]|nr:hypothetical protein [Thioalkalivibrio sp.]